MWERSYIIINVKQIVNARWATEALKLKAETKYPKTTTWARRLGRSPVGQDDE
jgi:hypothetical protein